MTKRQKNIKAKNPMQTAFTRFMLIVAFFILWIGGIGARLVHLQVTQHETLLGKALNQRRDQTKEKLLRGTIYDRSDSCLAMSVKAKSLFADPSEIQDVEKTAAEVAKVLKLKVAEILKPLKEAKENNKRFVWLARKLDETSTQKLGELLENKDKKLPGLHFKEEQKRIYPNDSLAAQVIGFSNSDDAGLAGIELSQEELLHGAVIKGWQDRDRLGRIYDESETEEREPPKDIVLTISKSIQYKTEQALEKGVKAANAKSGVAIVMNPKTGEILAMANYPTFDLNKFSDYQAENYTNRAVQSMYSPGSVFKLVTFGAALQEKTIDANGSINCGNGVIKVAGREDRIDKECQQTISYAQALAVSSNYVAIDTGRGLGKERFYDYSRKFGFGSPTGIELPAEANGQISPPSKWNADSLASMSIGYELNITAMQAVSAYAAIANDGIRLKPHIIKEIRQDGKIISAIAQESTQVISAEAAKNLRRMLREVVLKGTAKRAQLNGYTSAGKTGTAWKYDPKLKAYDENKYVSSFIGFAPADSPSVVIGVILDEPRTGARDGGQVSAPIFRDIAEQILPELNVIPDGNILQEILPDENIPSEIEALTTLKNAKTSDKKIVESEKIVESKNDAKLPTEDKKAVKQKTEALTNGKSKSKTKNKSSGTVKGKT
jgi:cell division protein FtsI/penicillin-binding protein 2